MQRREFLAASTATAGSILLNGRRGSADERTDGQSAIAEGRIYASPAEAIRSPREELAYVVGLYTGTKTPQPDYLATIDLDPASKTYSQIIHRLPMPNVGDELHHFGWNACGSCHGERERRYLIIPGFVSSRIHIVDTLDARQPKLVRVIEPQEVIEQTKLTAPHTVHCLADGQIMISMLGNAELGGPGGFLLLDPEFNIAGTWAASREGMHYNYDFWYQPRLNVMVSSEWAAPRTFRAGFNPADVEAGKYGRHLHFWDWEKRRITQSVDLGEKGLIPLEVRFHHNPESPHGFVGAALSSVMWHWRKAGERWQVNPVIEVPPRQLAGSPTPVPGLITDLVLSMDDKWLYFSNWLHGDVRQYDVSDPARPKLTGQLVLGGVEGKGPTVRGKKCVGGPQMLQLSLDGKRLYVTSSLFSTWDNQFYPQIAEQGSYMLQVDCNTEGGGLALNEDFCVDFGAEPAGPARAHEMRFLRGDSTSDIWF
jgi:selenium-binding protein 1